MTMSLVIVIDSVAKRLFEQHRQQISTGQFIHLRKMREGSLSMVMKGLPRHQEEGAQIQSV